MTPTESFTILWSRGPADNPDAGQFTIEARSVVEAAGLAEVAGLAPEDIDGVVRTAIVGDL